MQASAQQQVDIVGAPVSIPMMIPLAQGWTWIPCPYQTTTPLWAIYADFTPDDTFKSKTQFAMYYLVNNYYVWWGSLTHLAPGLGYKVKVAHGVDATFYEPQ